MSTTFLKYECALHVVAGFQNNSKSQAAFGLTGCYLKAGTSSPGRALLDGFLVKISSNHAENFTFHFPH
jgi:hypothetical protein